MAGLCERCVTREARSAHDLYCNECEREMFPERFPSTRRRTMADERCPVCGHAGWYFTGHVSREGAQQARCDICGSTWHVVPASTRRAFMRFRQQAREEAMKAAKEEASDG